MNLHALTQTKAALIDELLPLVKMHLHVEGTEQDLLFKQYIAAAVGAAANFLGRDVWPTERDYRGALEEARNVWGPYSYAGLPNGWKFDFRYGRARNVVFKLDDVAVVPSGFLGSSDPKAWGFIAYFATEQVGSMGLTLKSGYESLAEMPEDLVQFILVAVGMMNEVREMGNYSAVFPVEAYPTGLLQSWANPSVA